MMRLRECIEIFSHVVGTLRLASAKVLAMVSDLIMCPMPFPT